MLEYVLTQGFYIFGYNVGQALTACLALCVRDTHHYTSNSFKQPTTFLYLQIK